MLEEYAKDLKREAKKALVCCVASGIATALFLRLHEIQGDPVSSFFAVVFYSFTIAFATATWLLFSISSDLK